MRVAAGIDELHPGFEAHADANIAGHGGAVGVELGREATRELVDASRDVVGAAPGTRDLSQKRCVEIPAESHHARAAVTAGRREARHRA